MDDADSAGAVEACCDDDVVDPAVVVVAAAVNDVLQRTTCIAKVGTRMTTIRLDYHAL